MIEARRANGDMRRRRVSKTLSLVALFFYHSSSSFLFRHLPLDSLTHPRLKWQLLLVRAARSSEKTREVAQAMQYPQQSTSYSSQQRVSKRTLIWPCSGLALGAICCTSGRAMGSSAQGSGGVKPKFSLLFYFFSLSSVLHSANTSHPASIDGKLRGGGRVEGQVAIF